MSEKYTEIEAGGHLWLEHGHLDRDEALERARWHFFQEQRNAEEALQSIELGTARVFHQNNIYAVRKRREVK